MKLATKHSGTAAARRKGTDYFWNQETGEIVERRKTAVASNKKNTNDPSGLTRKVWVIEQRYTGFIHEPKDADWCVFLVLEGDAPETDVVLRCARLSEQYTNREFRYRYATLSFDGDGSKATIY